MERENWREQIFEARIREIIRNQRDIMWQRHLDMFKQLNQGSGIGLNLTNLSNKTTIPETEEELFSMYVRNEISEHTYKAFLPHVRKTKKEKLLESKRSKPNIKKKFKGRLKPWQ